MRNDILSWQSHLPVGKTRAPHPPNAPLPQDRGTSFFILFIFRIDYLTYSSSFSQIWPDQVDWPRRYMLLERAKLLLLVLLLNVLAFWGGDYISPSPFPTYGRCAGTPSAWIFGPGRCCYHFSPCAPYWCPFFLRSYERGGQVFSARWYSMFGAK